MRDDRSRPGGRLRRSRCRGLGVRGGIQLFEIVADIKTSSGEVERVSSQQTLNTRTHAPARSRRRGVRELESRGSQTTSGPGRRCAVQREVDQGAREDPRRSARTLWSWRGPGLRTLCRWPLPHRAGSSSPRRPARTSQDCSSGTGGAASRLRSGRAASVVHVVRSGSAASAGPCSCNAIAERRSRAPAGRASGAVT